MLVRLYITPYVGINATWNLEKEDCPAGVYKRGKSWQIDFYVPEIGERKRTSIRTGKSTEKILTKIKADIVENRYLDIRKKKKDKFKKLADLYLEYAKTNKRSWTRDKTSLRSLWSHFGDKYLCEISPLSIEEYKNIRRRQVTPATVNRELACLKHMFDKAIEGEMMQSNPMGQNSA